MNQLQEWFEKIAGVTQEERARRKFSEEFFGQRKFDASAFHTPAYWRRRPMPCSLAQRR